jgi:hypothetical protein
MTLTEDELASLINVKPEQFGALAIYNHPQHGNLRLWRPSIRWAGRAARRRMKDVTREDYSGFNTTYGDGVYLEFRGYEAWNVVDRAINDLIENQDLEETTVHQLIVGYIVKALVEAELLRTTQ